MKFNKSAMMSKAFKVSNVRLETGEGEEGGDAGDLTPARSIRFTQIELTAKQFEELYGREGAADFYFDYSGSAGDKSKSQPVASNHEIIHLAQVYKDCSGQIQFGVSDTVVEFESSRIKNITIDRTKGKFGHLRFTLVAPLPVKLSTLQLEGHFGKQVKLQISTGGIEQQDNPNQEQLGLEGGSTGEDIDDDQSPGEGVSGTGRKPRNVDQPAVN
jgi:hypothetical protein